jgi:hypothetical protein
VYECGAVVGEGFKMAEIADWFKGQPFFTRYWFGGTIGVSLLARFGLLPAQLLILNWDLLFKSFQVRLVLEILCICYCC